MRPVLGWFFDYNVSTFPFFSQKPTRALMGLKLLLRHGFLAQAPEKRRSRKTRCGALCVAGGKRCFPAMQEKLGRFTKCHTITQSSRSNNASILIVALNYDVEITFRRGFRSHGSVCRNSCGVSDEATVIVS